MLRALLLATALLLVASAANAQTSDDQALCQDDAFRVCSHTIPDRERTFQCMVQNRDALSPACRAVMARLLPPKTGPQKRRPGMSRSGSTVAEGEKPPGRTRKGGPVNLSPASPQ